MKQSIMEVAVTSVSWHQKVLTQISFLVIALQASSSFMISRPATQQVFTLTVRYFLTLSQDIKAGFVYIHSLSSR